MTIIDMGGNGPPHARRNAARPPQRGAKLYEVVIELVEQLIVSESLGPGELLPTQSVLAERAGVSLITVRRALDELEREGRVRRHQGVGTFVASPKIISRPTTTGALGNTLSAATGDSVITTQLLNLARVRPSEELAGALGCTTEDALWQVRRRRLMDRRPIMLETALIPVALAPDLDSQSEQQLGSLYGVLADAYGLVDDYEEQYLEVVAPDPSTRQLLDLGARSQVVRIRGLSIDARGTAFDCFEQTYPANDFVFGISGSASRELRLKSGFGPWRVTPDG